MKETPAYKGFDRILLAVDCIIFGFDGRLLKALCIKRNIEPGLGKWSLMGGFVGAGEDVQGAASRVLKELTGLENIYMEQLHCFGNSGRDPGGRVVSVAYSALININDYPLDMMKKHQARWFPIHSIPALIFDHRKMIKQAHQHLQEKAVAHPLSFEMLPEKFTMMQVQSLYEAIFDTTFDRRNFSKKLQSLDILRRLEEKETSSSRKGSFYFVFDKEKFKHKENQGIKFI